MKKSVIAAHFSKFLGHISDALQFTLILKACKKASSNYAPQPSFVKKAFVVLILETTKG